MNWKARFHIKRLLQTTSAQVLVSVSLVVLLGINLLITAVPLRFDLSRSRAYSLSAASKKILTAIQEPIEITFYVSDTVPAAYIPVKREVTDLLSEFKQASRRIRINIVDPKKDSKLAQSIAQEYGIMPLQFSQVQNDQFAVSTGYFSIGMLVNGNRSSIGRIDPANLEYNIVSAIFKMTQTSEQQVGLLGLDNSQEAVTVLSQILGQQFPTQTISADGTISSNIKTIVALDSQTSPLSADMVKQLYAFVMRGGKIMLFTSGMQPDATIKATPSNSATKPLLASFGVTVNNDLVLSQQSETVTMQSESGEVIRTKYPFWLTTNVFNADASYAANISYLSFPLVSSLTLSPAQGIVQKQLVKATPQSWVLTGNINLNPQSAAVSQPTRFSQPLLIAYAKNTRTQAQLLVIPSTRFIQDQYLGRSGNLEFVINMVNEFASNGALSGIRSRSLTLIPLPALSSEMKELFKWGNVIGLPALFIAWGVWQMKKRG